MAVAGDRDDLPDAAAALVIALAMQHKVHGFAGLRPDKRLIQIRSCTEGHVSQTIKRVQRGISVQGGERATVACVHCLEQVVTAFVSDFTHDNPVWTRAKRGGHQLAWSDSDLPRN